jgi:hypothetical protein
MPKGKRPKAPVLRGEAVGTEFDEIRRRLVLCLKAREKELRREIDEEFFAETDADDEPYYKLNSKQLRHLGRLKSLTVSMRNCGNCPFLPY